MADRLAGKTAIVVGAGQTPGDTIGNGRATAVLFAREGARVLAVDRDLERAEETVKQIAAEGGEAAAFAARRHDPVVVISNEVGLGVHPETELGLRYRDVLGRVNQRWSAAAATPRPSPAPGPAPMSAIAWRSAIRSSRSSTRRLRR